MAERKKPSTNPSRDADERTNRWAKEFTQVSATQKKRML